MKKNLLFVALAALAASVAQADTSATSTHALGRLYNGDEMFGIKPAIGMNNYIDETGGRSARAAYGIATELNLASPIGVDFTRWFIGPQSGLMYSHLGPSDANFFGANSNGNENAGANMLLIPVNLKAAVSPFSWLRVGAHGGANVIYRSIAQSVRIDETDLNWRLVPNAGADIDLAITRGVGVAIRPDWSFGGEHTVFSATAALGVALN